MDRIACVLINYNQDEVTLACIRSLYQGSMVPDIILVDNASEDFDPERYNEFENLTLIRNKDNLGFAGGNNTGIRKALAEGYDYILLLNNDTVVDPEMVASLYRYADAKTMTTAKMYYYDAPDVLWYAGGCIDYNKALACHFGKDEKDHGQYDAVKAVSFVTGCCMFIPKQIIEAVGLMDEKLFLYCEDMAYCLRVSEKGYQMVYVPEAKLRHRVGLSSGGDYSPLSVYYCNRNRFYLLKQYPFSFRAKMYTYGTRTLRFLKSLITKNSDRMILKAFSDYHKEKMGKYVSED